MSEAIKRLLPKQREVVERLRKGQKTAQIIEELGITRKAYECRRERAISVLRGVFPKPAE